MKPPKRKGETWTLSQLYGFIGGSDGIFPYAALTVDKPGDIYGATQAGGGGGTCQSYCGTVFEISP